MKVPSFVSRFTQTFALFVLAAAGTEARAVILPCQPTFPPLAQLPGVFISASAVGDYDNDGDLDTLLSGRTGADQTITRLYRNDGSGNLVDAGLSLPQVESGALAWGDFNNDGWLDFVLTGVDAQTNAHAQVFRNNGNGTFTDIGAGLTGVYFSTATWADYNNDGHLDLLITGFNPVSGQASTKLYRNTGGMGFVEVPSNLAGVTDGSAAWADFDNDGYLDLLLTGLDSTMEPFTRLYSNQGGTNFVNAGVALPAVFLSAVAWGDYNNDGRLDILLTGLDENFDHRSQVFRNLGGGNFVDALAGLPGVAFSAAAWGDFDNDGYLDLALAGEDLTFTPISRIYRNNGGLSFTNTGVALPGAALGTLALGDFNGDGALDLLLGGDDYASNILTHVYRNDCADTNTPPTAPGNLQVAVNGSSATFTWSAATDDHTPAAGLSYNLVVGTSLNAVNANSPLAAVPGGFRRVVRLGAQNENLSWKLSNLPAGTLSWSVQAIDTAFAGGPFAAAQSFTIACHPSFPELPVAFPGLFISASAVGDFDNDGDLDLLLSGQTLAGVTVTRLYRNDGGTNFTDLNLPLPPVEFGALAAGDFNNDGFLDFALTGIDSTTNTYARIYRNVGGTNFVDLNAPLTPVEFSSVTWADYNNDGYLDLLLTGRDAGGVAVARLYRNVGGTSFVAVPASFEGVTDGAVAWGDYDNDGDLDVVILGVNNSVDPVTRLYRNDGGTNFVNIGAALPSLFVGSAAWGDYDNDGDLDLLLTGLDENSEQVTRLLRNNGGSFVNVPTSLPGVGFSSAAWGDFDNDGYLDLALAGEDLTLTPISRIFHNNAGTGFSDTGVVLPGAALGTLAVGDFNGDGALDLLLVGDDYDTNFITKIFLNDCAATNQPPFAPGNLQVVVNGSMATFSWAAATDDHTPASGLSYNLVVGSSPNAVNLDSPMAAVPGGFRRVVRLGAQNQNLSWKLNQLPTGTLYWSVQAIDSAWAGGPFAAPQPVEIPCVPTFPPLAQLPGVFISASAVGDYDNDGDLDLLLSGRTGAGQIITRLYRNDGGGNFVDTALVVPQVESGALAWGDFNNDGFLDFVLTGVDAQTNTHAQVFRNNGNGTFTDLNAGLVAFQSGTATWADFNNDGFADLLLTGYSPASGNATAKLYRNTGGTGFVEMAAGLPGVTDGAAAWGDYDNDGDLDLLLTGVDSALEPITRLYRNDGGSFVNSGVALPGVFAGAAAFGDYNNDGRLDILVTGFDYTFDPQSWVLRNAGGGAFINAPAGLPGVGFSSAAWGDFDNDGYLDVALAGEDLTFTPISRIYHNNGGTGFSDTGVVLPGAALGTLAVGDFNRDSLLDLLLGGDDYASNIVTRVYRNDCAPTNMPPSAPGNLQVAVNGNMATFSWAAAADDHTAASGLSYNLVVGTSPALVDVNSPLSAVPGGFRRVVRLGAQSENLSWKLNGLPTGTLYGSVQAIDSAFAGGPFAQLQPFSISTCQPVTLAQLTNQVRAVGESATFQAVPSGTAPFSYQWSRNGTPLAGETNGSLTVPLVTLVSAGTYCVGAANACGRATNCAVLAVFDPFDACLISHWKFDEASGNTAVDSADGNTGTLVNGPVRTAGLFSGALRFDGQNDYVNVPDSRSLALTNRFTISLWFKPTEIINAASGRQDIFEKYASYWLSFNKLGDDGKLVFALNYTGPIVRSQRTSWNSNQWYHAAATLDGTNMNLYVNGVLEGSIATTDVPLNNFYPLQIGGDTENITYFRGCMDEVRLYGCALPAAEIASLARAGGAAAGPFISAIPDQTTPPGTPTAAIPFTVGDPVSPANALTLFARSSDQSLVPDAGIALGGGGSNRTVTITPAPGRTGSALITITVANSSGVSASETFLLTVAAPLDACLISHWKFDETSGNTAADSVDSNPGTLFNGPAHVPGRYGSALRFDGVNQYVNVADANNLDLTPSFTVSVWMNPSRLLGPGSGRKDLLKKYLAYWLLVNYPANDGRISFVLNDGRPFVQSTTATWETNQWYHIAATYDGATLKLYVNGALEGSTATTALPNKNSYPLQFGGNTDQRLWFPGALDDIRFYGCALTATQIAALSGTPAAPANQPPVISDLADQLITKNNATADLPFTVGDPESAASSLVVSGTSSNQTLVPNANITFAGSGSNRTVKITPAPNQTGTAVITVTVSDGALTATDTFVVNVTDSNAADPALISQWKLDETFGILALDTTGRNTGALLNGALRSTSGQSGSAVCFDGIDDHINVPDSNSLDLSNKFTLSLWFKPSQLLNGASGRKDLLQKFTSYWLILNYPANDGKLEFILNTGSPRVASTTTSWLSNQWYHAAATYDGATMKIYINGVLENSLATTALPNITTYPVQIGGNTTQGYWFPGCIDDVRIYGAALSSGQVQSLLTPPSLVPAAVRLPVLQLTMQGGHAQLKWNAEAGRAYQLQFKDKFSASWTGIGEPVTATAAQGAVQDHSPAVPQRFYRLVVLP